MNDDAVLCQHLLKLLNGRNAHYTIDDAVADFPIAYINTRPPNVDYTPWHLLEHIRLAQWDILEFIRDPHHVSPDWPAGYWPTPEAEADESVWRQTVAAIRDGLNAAAAIVNDPKIDLQAELPHAPGYTYLREILLIADHNAYHIGEFAILRQVMGTWPNA